MMISNVIDVILSQFHFVICTRLYFIGADETNLILMFHVLDCPKNYVLKIF